MFNVDTPGFPIALLAILAGLRLVMYIVTRLSGQESVPATMVLTPDEPAEPAALAAEMSLPAVPADQIAPPIDNPNAPADPTPEPAAAEDDPPTLKRFATELLDSGIIAVVLVFFIIRPFVLQAFYIPSGSMIPTLQVQDRLLAAKFIYHIREPRHGEVIVFDAPRLALEINYQSYSEQDPKEYVKRVIGVPGDRVQVIANDGVYVNDVKLSEPYVQTPALQDFPRAYDGRIDVDNFEARQQIAKHVQDDVLVVPEGYLFVMGDNRNDSSDSRKWGLLPRNRVVGKAFFIFWPFSRMGPVR